MHTMWTKASEDAASMNHIVPLLRARSKFYNNSFAIESSCVHVDAQVEKGPSTCVTDS